MLLKKDPLLHRQTPAGLCSRDSDVATLSSLEALAAQGLAARPAFLGSKSVGVSTCMYVYIHNMYILLIHIYKPLSMSVYIYIYMIGLYTCGICPRYVGLISMPMRMGLPTYMYVCVHIYRCIYVCMFLCTYVPSCIRIYASIYMCRYAYTYLHVCMYVYTHIQKNR